MNEAWELSKAIVEMTTERLHDVFNVYDPTLVFRYFNYDKAKAKIDDFNEYHVGDEVTDGENNFVVICALKEKEHYHLNCFNEHGGMRSYTSVQVWKTGKTYPEIIRIMKQMKGVQT